MSVDHLFIAECRQAIWDMRRAGMSDTAIACVLQEVRAAALHEERHRLEGVRMANPPYFPRHVELKKMMEEDAKGC